MAVPLGRFMSMFEFIPLAEDKLHAQAGIVLPESIDELTILDWLNPNCSMLQYNDLDQRILDTRVAAEASISSPVESMQFLPNDLVFTFNLFNLFCQYFGVPQETVQKLNRMVDQQSVVIFMHSQVGQFMAFPFFTHVNYHHYEIFPEISLCKLMEYQDQALKLGLPYYPFIYDTINTREDYINASRSSFATDMDNNDEPNSSSENKEEDLSSFATIPARKRGFDEFEEAELMDCGEPDQMDVDDTDPEYRSMVVAIQKHFRENDWQDVPNENLFDSIIKFIQ